MQAQPAAGPHILVIDDSAATLCVLEQALGEFGYRVTTAAEGRQGLALAAATAPDLILLDVLMHGMDGFETCRRLKAIPALAEVPVIFMTGLDKDKTVMEAFEAGGIDFVAKPMQLPETLQRIRAHIGLHKRNRAQLQAAQQQLIKSETMASLGRMVAGLTHDISTPVGVARTAGTVLSDKFAAIRKLNASGALTRAQFEQFMADGEELCRSLELNCSRAAELLGRLRSGAVDRASERRRRFDAPAYIGELMASMKPSLQAHAIALSLEMPAALEMDSFPGALAQVLGNLVGNAQDHAFGDGGGQLRISLTAGPGDGMATLTCADNGRGMAPELLARVFEPFHTTRRERGNSGLGMHIVEHLATVVLGGEVAVHSAVGTGTTVTLTLPLYAPE